MGSTGGMGNASNICDTGALDSTGMSDEEDYIDIDGRCTCTVKRGLPKEQFNSQALVDKPNLRESMPITEPTIPVPALQTS